MPKLDQDQLAKEVGKTIARRRQAQNLTQAQLAERLQMGMEAVSRIERGLVMPPVARLMEFARVLDCQTADLMGETSLNTQDQAQHLHQLLTQLNQADRDMVMDVVKRLVEGLAKRSAS